MARIIGIGTDIIECLRIAQMIERHGELFINRVYTPHEIQYCQSRKFATQHFAGRWAAKEAILKAIGAIDEAVSRLSGLAGEGMDPTSVDHDPTAHRETLSPDSDELEAIEAEDQAALEDEPEGAIDKSQWIDGDGRDR